MKKNFWKGLSVCTFLCMMTAAPSWADVCFLPTGECEQGSQTRTADAKTCQDYIDAGTYYAEKQHDGCNLANVPGCTLWECPAQSCEDLGYKLGPTPDTETYPDNHPKEYYECDPCKEGSMYKWKCKPRECPAGYTTRQNATCEPGYTWVAADVAQSGREPCGECTIEQCPKGTSSEDELPTTGCFTCRMVENLQSGKACYECSDLGEYITAAAKEELDESCYKFTETQSSSGEVCYLPTPLTCPVNQFVARTKAGEKTICSCEDYQYVFEVTGKDVENDGTKTGETYNTYERKILHYTAAGGSKKANVTSTQTGEETINWPYQMEKAPAFCDVNMLNENTVLKVDCPTNPTTQEMTTTFTLKQTEADNISTHTIEVKIIIDPDTCENPNDMDAACTRAGYAGYNKGPRPACYKTHLEASCSNKGDVPLDSGHKSIAGQICYYCVNDACPTGYEYGQTPAPAEGYLTEQTDVGNDCYKEKPCPEGYSTDYQDINSCTKNGHPEGWSFESNGLCGSKTCGKCKANTCTGEGKDVQCQATPFCDPSADSCGYKDPSTEYEGDTPKYNANIKQCPSGTAVDAKAPTCGRVEGTGKYSGDKECLKGVEPDRNCPAGFAYSDVTCACEPIPCPDGTSVDAKAPTCGYLEKTGAFSGTKECLRPHDPDRTCSDGYSYSDATCSCVCSRTCGSDEVLDETSCTCGPKPFVCPIGEGSVLGQPGTWGSACTEDSQCQSSGDYSLICVNKDEHGCGECKECGVYEHNGSVKSGLEVCKIKGIRDKGFKWFYVPASSSQSCDIKIGNNCLVKDPTQVFKADYNSGKEPSGGDSEESANCQNEDGSCKDGCYPDVTHDSSGEPYHFNRCQKPYEGEEAWGCRSGECIWEPLDADTYTFDKDGNCWQ